MNYYERVLELQPQNTELQTRISEREEIYKYENELKSMALSIVEDEKYDFKDEVILSEEFQEKISELKEPIIFKADDNNYIGIYPGGYIYYGDMINGVRDGNGYWYRKTKDRVNKVYGTWKNDVPNGEMVVEAFLNPDGYNEKVALYTMEKGTVENGLYTGEWYWFLDTQNDYCDHEFNIMFTNGIMDSLEIDSSGDDIAAYCNKCNGTYRKADFVWRIPGEY